MRLLSSLAKTRTIWGKPSKLVTRVQIPPAAFLNFIEKTELDGFLFSKKERIIMKEPLWMKKMKKHKKTIEHNRTNKLVDRLEKENSIMKAKKVKKKKDEQERKNILEKMIKKEALGEGSRRRRFR